MQDLNYELIQILRDSGFPQTPPYTMFCVTCGRWRDDECRGAEAGSGVSHILRAMKIPTEEEVIAQLGDVILFSKTDEAGNVSWVAAMSEPTLDASTTHINTNIAGVTGNTKLKALINLYITRFGGV